MKQLYKIEALSGHYHTVIELRKNKKVIEPLGIYIR